MLFNKKIKFSISESQIKEDFCADDKTVVLRVNLRFPQITCPKTDPLFKTAMPFYKSLGSGFYDYCKNGLFPIALKTYKENSDLFSPYSAIMRWENTFTDGGYISVIQKISVSDGNTPPITDIKTQVWQRQNGRKCKIWDFVSKDDLPEILKQYPALNKKTLNLNLFTLRDQYIEVYDIQGNCTNIEQVVKTP